MKRISLYVSVAAACFLLSACSQPGALTMVPTTAVTLMEGASEETGIRIEPAGPGAPGQLNLYRDMEFQYGGEDGRVLIYTSAEEDSGGVWMWDDSQSFTILAVIGENTYVLFGEEKVQLGFPEVDVFEDVDGVLHFVLRDVRTAQYKVYDFIYDEQEECLEGTLVMEYPGVNYWGGI